jgi:hypothetical protein
MDAGAGTFYGAVVWADMEDITIGAVATSKTTQLYTPTRATRHT